MTPYFSRLAQRSGLIAARTARPREPAAAAPPDTALSEYSIETLAAAPPTAPAAAAAASLALPAAAAPRHTAAMPVDAPLSAPDAPDAPTVQRAHKLPALQRNPEPLHESGTQPSASATTRATPVAAMPEPTEVPPAAATPLAVRTPADTASLVETSTMSTLGANERAAASPRTAVAVAAAAAASRRSDAQPLRHAAAVTSLVSENPVGTAAGPVEAAAEMRVAPPLSQPPTRSRATPRPGGDAPLRNRPGAAAAAAVQVTIGRIDIELVAPAAVTTDLSAAPSAPAAAAPQVAAFNAHRHYLRGG
ncbi:hypothetical protein DFR29_10537 [Tahibacter aquaticus]|uniref:Uncharacterized protein n=1 Tax=Tahibacter aquaticus TaxID=520092 RepID=A0A4V3DMJ8_9GAMM|nr:hypothetical protein [Tahibacter aquaticus]TDR44856.1 hypothetical protein DFR29_10537 [Tahibacter aquaticus]